MYVYQNTRYARREAADWARVSVEATQEAVKRAQSFRKWLSRTKKKAMPPIPQSTQTIADRSNNNIGIGKSFHYETINNFSKWKKLGHQKNIWLDTRVGRLVSAMGNQAVVDMLVHGSAQQCITNTAPPCGINQSPYSYFTHDPNQNITGNEILKVVASGGPVTPVDTVANNNKDNWSIFWKSVTMNFEFRNDDPIGTVIDLYFCMPKVDTNESAQVAFNRAVGVAGQGVVAQNYNTGSGQDPGTTRSTQPFCKPTDFKYFRELYKVVYKKNVFLAPGATEAVCIKFGMNKVLKYGNIQQRLGRTDFLKGQTIICMPIFRGTTTFNTDDNKGTYSSSQTSWSCTSRLTFQDYEPGPQNVQTAFAYSEMRVDENLATSTSKQKFTDSTGTIATQTNMT